MEQSGGEAAAKRAKGPDHDAGAGGEDRLSALPDDVLVLILLRLCIEDAARTSVLSRRWRRIWTLLPELRFGIIQDPYLLRESLSASDVPLRLLRVCFPDASAQSLAVWLPAAVRRVSGELVFFNLVTGIAIGNEEDERGTFELPYFKKATSICLDLGFLGLSMPPAGVFARLTDLDLTDVRFHSPRELEDAVSSLRCPNLQKLAIRNTKGLDSINIDSESLQLLELRNLRGVLQVTVLAPALKDFTLWHCFILDQNQPVVKISAPQLKLLNWTDSYDPSSVHLSTMERLQTLSSFFCVYGKHGFPLNHACLALLPRFKTIKYLILTLCYLMEIDNLDYLMEDMTMLPDITSLKLIVIAKGHAIGASAFHVLRLCSGIKRLALVSYQFNLKWL
ncbi:hypothetical protein EJB05_14005 [Eragrostis curvula]|uniref:F-box domain-containing protein n=1 Tax=Eragrostis curvula TaxID=38414 RepID=A0A5J9VX99_9POAL|nr:hypothetical protein EJB05_14005 [Eragrostis curvula]